MIEKLVFGMDTMRISQGINGGYSHKGTMSIDFIGKDSGRDNFKAPCTSRIVRKTSATVYCESVYNVQCPNGYIGFINYSLTHDNNISDLWVGKVIPQGQVFFQEGDAGNATGNHIHMMTALGKYTGGWYNSYGNWMLKNSIEPYKVMYVHNSTNIVDGEGYHWVRTADYSYKLPKAVPAPLVTWGIVSGTGKSGLNVRSSRKVRKDGKNIIGRLKEGDKVKIDRYFSNGWYSLWYGDHGGFVYAKYIKKI